jgi:hypothetical protein
MPLKINSTARRSSGRFAIDSCPNSRSYERYAPIANPSRPIGTPINPNIWRGRVE